MQTVVPQIKQIAASAGKVSQFMHISALSCLLNKLSNTKGSLASLYTTG